MPRGNGSYLGQTVNPNSNVASGIWTVREAEAYLRADKWPAQPTVPSAPTGTAGDGQVALTWTAPTGGSTPTDYIVQYSSNGGSSWTTFSDGVSTATSATVTGLANGTGYIFRVRAVNILGEGPYGSASGTITPAALNVALLLHFDGTNGSTTFTDSSPTGATVTAVGDAQISTAQSKFGGASGYFDSASALSVSDLPSDYINGDFTIEAWVLMDALGGGALFNSDPHWGIYIGLRYESPYTTVFYGNGSQWDGNFLSSGTLADNQWHHVAVVCNQGQLVLYHNGVAQGSANYSPYTQDTSAAIGSYSFGGGNFLGYVDEFRIVKGHALYTADFTPPTAPF